MNPRIFSAAERQQAHMIGQLQRSADGQTWTGHLSGTGGNTVLLTGRIEEYATGQKRLVLLARYGQTEDQKRLAREAREAGA